MEKRIKKAIWRAGILTCLFLTAFSFCMNNRDAAAASKKAAEKIPQEKTIEKEIEKGWSGDWYKIRLKEDDVISLHFEAEMKKGKLHIEILPKDKNVKLKGGKLVLGKSMPETNLTSGMMYAGVYYIRVYKKAGKQVSGKYSISYL